MESKSINKQVSSELGFFNDQKWKNNWAENEFQPNSNYKILINKFENNKHFVYVGRGRHRAGYLHINSKLKSNVFKNEWIIKVPVNYEGHEDNEKEALMYRKNIRAFPKARCRLWRMENHNLLVMEKLLVLYSQAEDNFSEIPDWAEDIECCQFGRNCKGQIVAYDFANEYKV